MAQLDWRITLLTLLVLPAFIYPARRIGPRSQKLTREGMQLNAEMNNLTVERFNVAGALLAKLFGRPDDERDEFAQRAGGVRDVGVRSAMYSRVLFVVLGFVAAVGTAIVYCDRRQPRDLAARSTSRRRVAAFVLVRRADLPTARAAHERPGRRPDHARVVRAGVRGPRLPGRDRRPARRGRPRRPAGPRSSSTTCGSATPTRRPSRSPSLEGAAALRAADEPSDSGSCATSRSSVEPGETVALVGPSGAGKTTIAMLVPAYRRRRARARCSVDGHDVRDLTLDSLHAAIGLVPQDPHLFHDTHPREPALRRARRDRRRARQARCEARAHLGPRRVAARRARHDRRRARLPHVGRREATARDRAAAVEGPRDRHPRRGDVAPRLRIGARDPARRSTKRCATGPRS